MQNRSAMIRERSKSVKSQAVHAALLVSLALLAAACVAAEGEPALGEVMATPGLPIDSSAYQPSAAGPNAAAANGVAPGAPTTAAGAAPAPAGNDPAAAMGSDPAAAAMGSDPAASGAAGAPADATTDPAATGAAGAAAATDPSATIDPSAAAPASAPASGGTLTISFTTVDLRGRYAPRNIGAVWVATGSGSFVKTLERWAGVRANHLSKWNAASGGWSSFFGFGATDDELDAVSRATLTSHQMHSLTWDMVGNDGAVVPDGSYKVMVEMTDNETGSAVGEVAFDKGPGAVNLSGQTSAAFTGFNLDYQP
ncbi:MAG: DUF2271 domain-containing protein [Myxococcales bacterium]|nr:DUF2271 domain-containing protein [Myxococcales bacterium]